MPLPTIVGFSGNVTRPSRTRAFIEQVALAIEPAASPVVYDIDDLGPSLLSARSLAGLDAQAQRIVTQILEADLLIVGSPTYKGSYTGLFKHLFDLLDPASLRGKPVLLTATGGGDRHSLMIEHQLRPLFGFFEAFTLPTAIYASNRDTSADGTVSEALRARIDQAVADARWVLRSQRERHATVSIDRAPQRNSAQNGPSGARLSAA